LRFFRKKPLEKQGRRGDEYHRREERKQWARQNSIATVNNRITGFGVFFSLVAAGSAVGAAIYARGAYVAATNQAQADWTSAHEAQAQTKIAEEAFVNSNRPWVFVEIPQWSDLTYGPNGLTLTLAIKTTNFGNAPAIGVDVWPGFVLTGDDQFDKMRT
jgi:hypothetical protein